MEIELKIYIYSPIYPRYVAGVNGDDVFTER